MLVRASAPKWIERKATHYRDWRDDLADWGGAGRVGKLAAELAATCSEIGKTLSEVASSIKHAEAEEYKARRDLIDDLAEEELDALESGVEACKGIASARLERGRSGRLPKAHIQERVRAHYESMRQCYENGLTRNAELSGLVSVRFIIAEGGAVENVTVNGRLIPQDPLEIEALHFLEMVNGSLPPFQGENNDMPDDDTIECVASNYYRIKFDPPEEGIVTVVYPVMFARPEP